jgi:hypothetical protein
MSKDVEIRTLSGYMRVKRDVTMVEFDDKHLGEFIEFLNSAHIVKDGYLRTFALRDVGNKQAVIDVTVHRFNGDD